ncbi:MAG: hypothetical protein EOO75_12515, partial [Myxococcales bacterium]
MAALLRLGRDARGGRAGRAERGGAGAAAGAGRARADARGRPDRLRPALSRGHGAHRGRGRLPGEPGDHQASAVARRGAIPARGGQRARARALARRRGGVTVSKPGLDPLRRLGQAVASEQDEQLAGHPSLRQARARLLAAEPPARARWVPSPLQAFALSAALTTALLLTHEALTRRAAAVTFQAAGAPGAVDAWLAAPTTAALPLRFSDGSALDLAPGSRARVASVAPEGARVVLERGRADVAVVHRSDTRWVLSAGPFEVRVTGTRFAVEWDAAHEVFRLAMAEGSVVVTGACLTGPSTFRGGDALSLACPGRPAAGSPAALAPRPTAGAPAGSLAASAAGAPDGPDAAPAGAAGAPAGATSAGPTESPPGEPAGPAGPTGASGPAGPARWPPSV